MSTSLVSHHHVSVPLPQCSLPEAVRTTRSFRSIAAASIGRRANSERRDMPVADLFKAARDRIIGLSVQIPGMTVPRPILAAVDRPCLVFFADDRRGGADPGPLGFFDLDALARWAAQIVINPLGEQGGPYNHAVDVALMQGRLVLVETSPGRAAAWRRTFADTDEPAVILSRAPFNCALAHVDWESLH